MLVVELLSRFLLGHLVAQPQTPAEQVDGKGWIGPGWR
jgi:hypothetical protein